MEKFKKNFPGIPNAKLFEFLDNIRKKVDIISVGLYRHAHLNLISFTKFGVYSSSMHTINNFLKSNAAITETFHKDYQESAKDNNDAKHDFNEINDIFEDFKSEKEYYTQNPNIIIGKYTKK